MSLVQVGSNVPRFYPGKFGQAVLVEEGATNLLSPYGSFETDSNSDGLADGWSFVSYGSTASLSSDALFGAKSQRITSTATDTGEARRVERTVSITGNKTYTFSAYAKTDGVGFAGLRIDTNGASPVVILTQGTSPTTWQRFSITFTAPADATQVIVRCYNWVAAGTVAWVQYDGAQLEEHAYTTSFIDSTRSPETLTIPTAGVFPDINNFTIELWAKAQTIKTDTYQGVFGGRGILGAPPVDLLIATNNQLFLCYYNSAGTNTPLATGYYISDRTNWHYYAVTFCNGTVRIYVDGIKVKEANITLAQTTGNGNFYIGKSIVAAEYWNGLIDDLRISSRARTDAEIAAAYASGLPLPVDEDTTYKLAFDGNLNAQTPIAEGPSIKQAVINYRPVTEALEALAEKAGFIWYIDAYKVLHFVERAAYTAPWTAFGSDMLHGTVSVEHANPKYRNRQYIKGGRDITDPQTETRVGDGNTKSFAVGFPIAKVPTVKVNGVVKTVGIKGVDTGKDWYWSKGDPIIVQDESAVALTSSDTLEVTYQGEYDIVVISSDYSAIEDRKVVEGGGTGYVEDVADEPEVTSRDAAFESAHAKLKRYAVIGRRLRFRTKKAGLRPAQLLTVNLPEHELNNAEMLIESVTVYDENGIIFYDVTAVEGPEQGSWSKMFAQMATRGLAFVERINIGENEILIVLHTVSENWAWAENVVQNVFACPVPSTDLYPSVSLYPC